ncbi:MAG: hypothetical protein ABIJ09_19115 [Pseudomonadota bacterium]
MSRAVVFLCVLLAGYGLYRWVYMRPSSSGAGPAIDVTAEPRQEKLTVPERVTVRRDGRDFVIEKHHRYQVQGQVLSAATYNIAFATDFYDVDLGLIWGPRIDEFLGKYKFSQNGRYLFWRSPTMPPADEVQAITRSIGNNHLIPGDRNPNLDRALKWVSKGDRVRIDGYLVTIQDSDGRSLATSSTSRDDSGNGACEIVWVDEIQIGDAIYR